MFDLLKKIENPGPTGTLEEALRCKLRAGGDSGA
jgi:hypothetical protein